MTEFGLNLRKFEEDGFFILRNAVDPGRIAALVDEWEQFQAAPRDSSTPKTEPAAVFWRHVKGERKRVRPISEFPALQALALDPLLARIATSIAKHRAWNSTVRLLETIIFFKPPEIGGRLNWHQDNAYFPFEPNNQCALWIPLDPVDEDNGTLIYVRGSHRAGPRASTDLHSGAPFTGESRPPIPLDPTTEGYETVPMILKPGDITVHDGMIWHCSAPNVSSRPRRALSLRYLIGDTKYLPRAGSAAAFIEQVDVKAGDIIDSPAFPIIAA